jgi:hypothetical protein
MSQTRFGAAGISRANVIIGFATAWSLTLPNPVGTYNRHVYPLASSELRATTRFTHLLAARGAPGETAKPARRGRREDQWRRSTSDLVATVALLRELRANR